MEIVLLRHGKPDIHEWKRIETTELHQWIESYNASGIDKDYPPTEAAIQTAHRCNAVVCSDFPRSVQSANMLGITAPMDVSAIYREVDLPYGRFRSPKLPPNFWAVFFRGLWMLGYANNGEPLVHAKRRAVNCANKLVALSEEHGSVMLVGHGFINRFIAKVLQPLGWIGPKKPGRHYWEFSVYRK